MKLKCVTSKVSWFTVGREYDATWLTLKIQWLLHDDAGDGWELEEYADGYRTERLEDAEFAVVTGAPTSADMLNEIRQMAFDEGIGTEFNAQVVKLRKVFDKLAKKPETQRAFLLALAYIGEEKA